MIQNFTTFYFCYICESFLKLSYLDIGALFVIASSSGAIKACIASGGANQFAQPNTPGGSAIYPQFIACFFAILYFMSNAAGLSASIFAQKILGTNFCLITSEKIYKFSYAMSWIGYVLSWCIERASNHYDRSNL